MNANGKVTGFSILLIFIGFGVFYLDSTGKIDIDGYIVAFMILLGVIGIIITHKNLVGWK